MARSTAGTPITFAVPGSPRPTGAAATRGGDARPTDLPQGRVKHSVRVGTERGGAGAVAVEAVPGEDVVVLRIANGPALMLHPETARDLLQAQSTGADRSARPTGTVAVPARLGWPAAGGATRGLAADVLLAGVDVLTDLFVDKAATFVASEIVRRVDAQAVAGVYRLAPDGIDALGEPLPSVPSAGEKPQLVFVHGTFSTIEGTFAKLWTEHPQRVRTLFEAYGAGSVLGLEHPTLGVSPVANALALARALAPDTRVHLVTHSRGGLVAEALARVCADPGAAAKALGATAPAALREELKALAAVVQQKKLRVDRVVRVACPSRGTLLASKRLDAYVSVLKWTLELARIPVLPVLVEFLGQVAKRRADPDEMPGLAAQMPDSALVKWLNDGGTQAAGSLRVVAGDLQGDSVTSWLKTLLADAFYWTDNDLVVQTRSMYGGAPRAGGATFVLDQGGGVSHFNYFANERTASAVVEALVQDAPRDFRQIGPLSWAGQSSTGLRAARAGALPSRPAVVLLPGIVGSHLKAGSERVWLSWRIAGGLDRLRYDAKDIAPDGPVGMFYDELVAYLSRTHEVIEHAFDWRRPIEESARLLADAVAAALDARTAGGQPVRLLAHSMGGLVARALELERPDVWKRMMAVRGARLLMLGTPNGGSWAPMQVLSGDDTFGNVLSAVGAPFQESAARQVMAQFPGFLQLQAGLLDRDRALHLEATWQKLADDDLARLQQRSPWHRLPLQWGAYRWGVPAQRVLDRAVALRRRLDDQAAQPLGAAKDALLLVVGRAPSTPDGFDVTGGEVVYLDRLDEGDGRVPVERAVLPGVPTWKVDAAHGDLPAKKDAFKAYLELLETGTTALLPPLRMAAPSRGAAPVAAARGRSRPSRTRVANRPPAGERDVYARTPEAPPSRPTERQTTLRVTVEYGDLTFVRHPLLLGHYRSLLLMGTERVMNRLVGGAMEDSLAAGLYPEVPGEHQIFVNRSVDAENPWRLPRPEAVVVVGLGEEGKLRPDDLVKTIRQAAIAWVQRKAEQRNASPREPDANGVPAVLELAATLVGSGGGIEVAQSAQLIAQGVREANERLAEGDWPVIGHLHLIELYLNRAGEAQRALRLQSMAAPGAYLLADTLVTGTGGLSRPIEDGYRGADYDFIAAVARKSAHGAAEIAYAVDTKRARTEVTGQTTQVALVRELIANAASDRNRDTLTGRTLFQLLVPLTLEPFFGGTTDMLLELDDTTAGIPWELLDTGAGAGGDSRPWAIRAKLLRKLRTETFRRITRDAGAEASILVIGEPLCDRKDYPELPGARAEARAVVDRFGPASGIKALIARDEDPDGSAPDALAVVGALLERDWRVVHVAGHGALPERIGPAPRKDGDPPQAYGNPRGVVLSNGSFLGPAEIESMRVVPELVFVNCCHLGAHATDRTLGENDPPGFAANVADALIRIGVRCVVAAGWAVDDGAASLFATTFYGALLRGLRFADAVAEARAAAWAEGGNTWAAYQCYGDPDWRLAAGASRPGPTIAEEFAGIASPAGLHNALETLVVKSRYQNAGVTEQRERLRHLEGRFAALWGGSGRIAEAFGAAWTEAQDAARGLSWYEKAVAAEDGSASFKAAEQIANLRARAAWESVAKGRPSARALGLARTTIARALGALEKLCSLQETTERASVAGSAWKRLAMIEGLAGRPKDERTALDRMRERYAHAEALAGAADLFYPAMNRMAAELVLRCGDSAWKGLDAASVAAARRSLEARARNDPDFWSVVGQTELRVYEALAARGLAAALPSILREYDDLRQRVGAAWMWSSVRDQLAFILPKYAARARGAEPTAAGALLAHVTGFAETGASAASGDGERTRRKRPAKRVRR
jgi:pimeloyl-ACP methyl ester carboxylesterase